MSILKKSRILSVDDFEDNLTLVRTLLEDEGYYVD
jgi:CheY-like chemotaxis protein